MVSIITKTTITILSNEALAASLPIISILLLILMLLEKELAPSVYNRGRNLVKILNIAIVPLLMIFIFIVVAKIVEVIR